MFVSREPEATNSPYGWKSKLRIFDLWPVNVLTTAKNDSQLDLHTYTSTF